MNSLTPFPWYGGKATHLDWLLPLLPRAYHFVDLFGGSAAVILSREPSPIETYNDRDGELVNFFHVLRDHTDELIHAIVLTPYSREEYVRCIPCGEGSELERARRFFVVASQTMNGKAQSPSPGQWSHAVTTSHYGMAATVSKALGCVNRLPGVAARFKSIQVENRPALDIIRLYDRPGTLFYVDPPYVHASRVTTDAYRYEMTDREHRGLARALHRCKGRAAISGYRCDLMDKLYGDWQRIDATPRPCHASKDQAMRQESLWVNYEAHHDHRTPLNKPEGEVRP